MLPIAPLMVEHRIIGRMIRLMKDEAESIKATKKPDAIFIDTAVDFIQTYADATHHGKEEKILFRELGKKGLSQEHRAMMDDLIRDHAAGRKATAGLAKARERLLSGDAGAVDAITEKMLLLSDFYPRHIEKEDRRFFVPAMAYFTPEEQQAMLEEGYAFDRRMVHLKYDRLVGEIERARNIAPPKRPGNWLDFM